MIFLRHENMSGSYWKEEFKRKYGRIILTHIIHMYKNWGGINKNLQNGMRTYLVTVVLTEHCIILLLTRVILHKTSRYTVFYIYWILLYMWWGRDPVSLLITLWTLNTKSPQELDTDHPSKMRHCFFICLQPPFSLMSYQAWKHLEHF